MRPDPPLPPLFDRTTARAAGLTDRQIDRRLANGVWTSQRRGQLRLGAATSGDDTAPYDVLAAARTVAGGGAVISHTSAARWWGLPRPLAGWGEVTLTLDAGSARHRDGVRVHAGRLPPEQVVIVPPGSAGLITASADLGCGGRLGEVAVTSVARTVIDCLRTLPPPDALAIADAAVHRQLVTVAALAEALASQPPGRAGARQARALLRLVDGRRESPLESWSAWAFDQEGIPQPVWQPDVLDLGRQFVARVDAWWSPGLIGEADGRLKYRLAAAERGGATPEVLQAILDDERLRQRRLEDLGAEILRWGARDVLTDGPRHDLGLHIRERLLSATRHSTWRGRLR